MCRHFYCRFNSKPLASGCMVSLTMEDLPIVLEAPVWLRPLKEHCVCARELVLVLFSRRRAHPHHASVMASIRLSETRLPGKD